MKKWIRFECGDVICAKVKKLNNREYRVTTDHGWLFVSWRQVFDTQKQAKENKPRVSLSEYTQIFRRPMVFKPWFIDHISKKEPIPIIPREIKPGELKDFVAILEPRKSPICP